MRGDLCDPAFAAKACAGADVVYNCTNPAHYHRWADLLPPLYRAAREGARAAGARLVQLDNLYMYGRGEAGVFHSTSPMAPCSDKGSLRAALAQEHLDAQARGDLIVTFVRASDFFGPGADQAVLGDRALDSLERGRALDVLGDPDQPHSYTFTRDVVEALAIVGADIRADGKIWHAPTSWHGSTRGLLELLADACDRPVKIRAMPRWLLRTLGVAMPSMAALAEMTYQWEAPFRIDDGDFCRTFGVRPTPIADAITATVAAWRRTRLVRAA